MRRPKYTAEEIAFGVERKRVEKVMADEQVKAKVKRDKEKPHYKQPLTLTIKQAQAKMDKVAESKGYNKHSLIYRDATHYYFKLYERTV